MMFNKSNIKIIYYLFLCVISFQYALINTDLEIVDIFSTLLMVIELFIFLVWIISQKYSIKTFIIISIFMFIALVTYITTGETVFMIMLMIAVMSAAYDYNDIFRWLLFLRILGLFMILLASFVGILELNQISIVKGGTSTTVVGYGLGFNHPNQLAYAVGLLIILYVCLENKNINYKHMFGISIISLISYYITKTRTLLVIVFVLLFLIFLYKNKITCKFFVKCMDSLAVWFIPFCSLIALGLPLLMSRVQGKAKVILYAINGMIGSRFTHSERVFDNYPLTLFGGIVDFEILQKLFSYSTVDNGYLKLLYNFGIIGFAVFMLFYWFSIKRLINKKEYVYVIAIMSIAMWGISENILRSFAYNFTIIFWSEILKNDIGNNLVLRKNKRIRIKI